MASDGERRYHEDWLGRVQPIEGLVFSVPVLTEARCKHRRGPEGQKRFAALCKPSETTAGAHVIAELPKLLNELLEFTSKDFDIGDAMLEGVNVYVHEGEVTLRPTMALRTGDGDTPATRYGMLVWSIPEDLALDRKEKTSSDWYYTPADKLARMLTATGVPIGLLCNGLATRLIYCPRGESLGAITFVTNHMLSVDGRPVLDAFWSLLSAARWFTVPEQQRLPALLRLSRERQQDVTTALAEQVFEALTILLRGVEEAAERDGDEALKEALAQEDEDVVYKGLLTVLLRMVFVLYAEDRGLLHTGDPIYQHMGLLPLYEQLVVDAGNFPDTMDQRFGAWPRLLTLFRAIYFGAGAEAKAGRDEFYLPPRQGDLFNPHAFGFLEGWGTAGAAPTSPEERACLRVPTVSDGAVYLVLDRLLILDGQRLSYRSLEVEQIGSVYEALMGYRVERVFADSVCLRPQRVWVSVQQLREQPKAGRAKWLKELGLSKAQAKKLETTVLGAEGDAEALAALAKFAFRGLPEVKAGRLVIQPGEERRRTSSHYTPRSLSEPIVKRTLEPLLRGMGLKPSSEQLLSLTICDPAMGSGAFLVAACRTLAAQVEEAWGHEGQLERLTAEHGDPAIHARRLVAQRCLYGVDKNPLAVDLAKLSLWLETLAEDEPFTFLDHALKCGDSLVGLFLPQVRAFDWKAPVRSEEDKGSKQLGLYDSVIVKQVEKARLARERLLELAGQERRDADLCVRKEELHREAEAAIERVRIIADVAIGAFFDEKKDKKRDAERKRRRALVEMWLQSGGDARLPVELKTLREKARRLRPFHWPIEFPEVFWGRRRDPLAPESTAPGWLDAIVGNPPFAGKNGIIAMGGREMIDWLKTVHKGAHGNADYSAHFLRRAAVLLGEHGAFGLITTNTICQGDTRESGLKPLVARGGVIYDATRSREWPGAAAVSVSVVHLVFGRPAVHVGWRSLDGNSVPVVNSRLRSKPERKDPVRLRENSGQSFVGSIVLGMGFTLTPAERKNLIRNNPRNNDRIFPYLGGEEVNTSPTHDFHRYVISFGNMTLSEAERWPELLSIVREKVKPERDRNKREVRRKYWWRYGEVAPALYRAIEGLPRCLVAAIVTKHLTFAFQPIGRIFSHKLYIFPFADYAHFSVLQSRVHGPWAWLLSSTMRNAGLNYSASDCFETFPFPLAKHLKRTGSLEAAGKALYEARAAYMIETDKGLTKTYNALKDTSREHPRLVQLRELHIAMDRAVLAAYGWSDLTPPPFTDPQTDEEKAVHQEFEDEVIDRLFALNARRAAAEKRLGKKRTKSK